jgi:hypothetical protein
MAPPPIQFIPPESIAARKWWGLRRVRYNVGLVAASVLAFLCYNLVLDWGASIGMIYIRYASFSPTVAIIAGYLLALLPANVCYPPGPSSEKLFRSEPA